MGLLALSARVYADTMCVRVDGGGWECREAVDYKPGFSQNGSSGSFGGGSDSEGGDTVGLGGLKIILFPTGLVITTIPPEPHRATCNENVHARLDHANRAIALTQSKRLSSFQPAIPAGAIVLVQFYQGGTEMYQISSPASSSPTIAALEGTLACG